MSWLGGGFFGSGGGGGGGVGTSAQIVHLVNELHTDGPGDRTVSFPVPAGGGIYRVSGCQVVESADALATLAVISKFTVDGIDCFPFGIGQSVLGPGLNPGDGSFSDIIDPCPCDGSTTIDLNTRVANGTITYRLLFIVEKIL